MEIAANKNGTVSAFCKMNYERAGRNPRNYLKGVRCMGLIVEADSAEQATIELLTNVRKFDAVVSDQLMEKLI
jgi:hypothetical protein